LYLNPYQSFSAGGQLILENNANVSSSSGFSRSSAIQINLFADPGSHIGSR